MLVSVLLVGTLTSPSAQAVTREWGRLHLASAGGIWEAEAHGTAGWKNGQPRVRARFVDYNGMADNDQTFVQVKFYKHRSWVCGINGQRCFGYRLEDTKRTGLTYVGAEWYTDVVRLGHQAVGRWKVRARVCDRDASTRRVECSRWSRYLRVH
ncbi:MAG TPA: hypothetical protein VGP51_05205 [Nocardioidaceae bacterium]|nr:hypothetical protein [Nocardioidaceae bacterium]